MAQLSDSSSVKVSDLTKFTKACDSTVMDASRALQFAVDVEEGSLMIGHVPFKLWKMPVPPMASKEVLQDRVIQLQFPLWTAEQRKAVMAEEEGDPNAEVDIYSDDGADNGNNADDDDETTTDDDATDSDSESSEVDGDEMESDGSDRENVEDDEMTDAEAADSPVKEYNYVVTQADLEYDDNGPDYMYPVRAGELAYDAEDEYEAERPATPQLIHINADDDDEDYYEYDSENDITFEGWPDSDDESNDEGQLPAKHNEKNVLHSPIGSTWSSLTERRRKAANTRTGPVTLPSMKAPSPPRFYQTPPHITDRGDRGSPVYWKTGLTGVVIDWLANPQTVGWQMSLSHVKLGRLDGSSGVEVDARDGHKIKLTRMNIDPVSEMVGPRDLPLQWLLIEATYGDGAKKGRHPYWLLALPSCAISDAKLRVEVGSKSMVTACTIGVPGRAPMVHGYGMKRRCFERFMKACAEGKGQIVVESNEAFTL